METWHFRGETWQAPAGLTLTDALIRRHGAKEAIDMAHDLSPEEAHYLQFTQKQLRQMGRTPRWLFDWLSERFGPFAIDLYANEFDALCESWVGEDSFCGALIYGVGFGNPPFAMAAEAVRGVLRDVEMGGRCVLLLPASVNSHWYHDTRGHALTLFPRGRIAYDPPPGIKYSSPDRDSMIMAFGWGSGTVETFDPAEIRARQTAA